MIKSVGVVGAGFMGSGIAETAARAGVPVTLYEPEAARAASARDRIEVSFRHQASRGRMDAEAVEASLARLAVTDALPEVARADLVIEAVPEDEQLKNAVFSQLDAEAPARTILASNTSSIPIAQLAAATSRPDRVVGLHFFSPVPVMKLVEVVVALDTSSATIDAAETFSAAIGKLAIRTKDRSGFIVNMLLVPYLMAAVRMFEEGFATREAIDEGMRHGCGHPMGPLTLCDFIGLDVLYAVCDSLYEEFKRPEYAPPPLLRRMVVSGHTGRKGGRGFYDYFGQAGSARPDQKVSSPSDRPLGASS